MEADGNVQMIAPYVKKRSPRKKCSKCQEKASAKDGLCFLCWKEEHPGQEWPYKVKKETHVEEEKETNIIKFDQKTQDDIYRLIDCSLLKDSMDLVDTLCEKRGIKINNTAKTQLSVSIYEMIYSEGVKA